MTQLRHYSTHIAQHISEHSESSHPESLALIGYILLGGLTARWMCSTIQLSTIASIGRSCSTAKACQRAVGSAAKARSSVS